MKDHKIYADDVDGATLSQFYDALKQPFSLRGALMADAHRGYALPIGGVIATEDTIVPAWIGYDIGCGVGSIKTPLKVEDLEGKKNQIFEEIYRAVPTGLGRGYAKIRKWDCSKRISSSTTLDAILSSSGKYSLQLGTLGSGNHFIEIGADEDQNIWIIVHSGSRALGHAVAKYYMTLASPYTNKATEGHFGLKTTSVEGKAYIMDMNYCLEYALENRRRILEATYEILISLKEEYRHKNPYMKVSKSMINRNHNHADFKDGMWIHRKGATHAELGMRGIIPGNMRDGAFITEGKGNPDSLCSSSHGAGRVKGRAQAKRDLSLDEFKETMKNVVAKVGTSTIDEAPDAYKDIFKIIDLQKDLVTVIHLIKPLINIKG